MSANEPFITPPRAENEVPRWRQRVSELLNQLEGLGVNILNDVDVNIQDQHTRTGDVFFSQVIGSLVTLAADTVADTYDLEMNPGHGILVGEQLVLFDTESGRLYIGEALTVVSNDITVDTPINFAYPAATSALTRSAKELNIDGSTTRQTYSISNPLDLEIDITRVMLQMQTTNFPELDMFGDIVGGLTRGLVLRVTNGINVNYFNVKQNGDFALMMFDIKEYEAAKHGINGLGGRLTYAGQSKHGVVIRLAQGDSLDIIIQDDLTSLVKFRMLAAFHVVDP